MQTVQMKVERKQTMDRMMNNKGTSYTQLDPKLSHSG